MNRDTMIARLGESQTEWDLIIVGGGATGLGTAIDAAVRGYRVALLEQSDFAKGTSSRSTKLVHGGVRYLQQGNISLVLEALKERGILRDNAPHLVHDLPFIVPNYDWWEAPFYGIGLRIYDMLAGKHGFGPSKNLSKEKTIERIPTIETEGLRGGVIYYDGQFDDARLAINMASTAVEQGATLVNYMRVSGLVKHNDMIQGVRAIDEETGTEYTLKARAVINATGVFADSVRRLDEDGAQPMIAPSQGVHLVLDKSFLPGDSAIMVPHTDDGRVLFAIPWHDHAVVGTTDTPVDSVSLEPRPLDEEIEFLLKHAAQYLSKDPVPSDVKSVFAGLRPLVSVPGAENTAALSRDHTIHISRAGLVTVAGGKWTTYRRMAEDVVDQAATLAGLEARPCSTTTLRIHGYHETPEDLGRLGVYGSDAAGIEALCRADTALCEPIHGNLPVSRAQIQWGVEHEMARTVDDVLARRTRSLLLDARAARDAAPDVANVLAGLLGRDEAWAREQTAAFVNLAKGYILGE